MRPIYLPLFILFWSSIFVPINAGSSCDSFPRPGFDIKREENGEEKFIATAEISVPFDDRDLYLDSIEEAEIEAKLKIAKFLNEEISGLTDIEKKSTTQVRVEGRSKTASSEIVRTKLKKLSSNTPNTLMRGVRVLGSCYTPGSIVRVSVGWKLQDIESAKKMSNTMKSGNFNNFFYKKNQNPNKINNSNIDFSPVGGYSDKNRLKNF